MARSTQKQLLFGQPLVIIRSKLPIPLVISEILKCDKVVLVVAQKYLFLNRNCKMIIPQDLNNHLSLCMSKHRISILVYKCFLLALPKWDLCGHCFGSKLNVVGVSNNKETFFLLCRKSREKTQEQQIFLWWQWHPFDSNERGKEKQQGFSLNLMITSYISLRDSFQNIFYMKNQKSVGEIA